MSHLNSIKDLLEIKDPNITIENLTKGKNKKGTYNLIEGTLLDSSFNKCPHCGFEKIVKNGTKKSKILINRVNNQLTYLSLKKQRYSCTNCKSYFTASTDVVDKNCFISKQIHFKILEELTETQSMSNIARHTDVSPTTIQRVLTSVKKHIKVKRNWLPEYLLFDEFRSLKHQNDKFSFSCMDGNTGKLFDILPSRRSSYLYNYFLSFEKKARDHVRYVVIDMNAAYHSVIKKCFPNAQIVVDRFHIVQLLIRSFETVRKKIMNQFNKNSKEYKLLKNYYRLLLKDEDKLNYLAYVKRRALNWTHLNEVELVDRMLSISEELKIAYHYYQNLKYSFNQRNAKDFFDIFNDKSQIIPKEFISLKNTFQRYKEGIKNAFKLSYSNAKLENLHTHIKTIKRNAYGFKNFSNMRVLIFLKRHCVLLNKN